MLEIEHRILFSMKLCLCMLWRQNSLVLSAWGGGVWGFEEGLQSAVQNSWNFISKTNIRRNKAVLCNKNNFVFFPKIGPPNS
jgi:hypothetical protein